MSHPEEPPIHVYDMTDPGDRRAAFEDQCKDLRYQILGLDSQVHDLLNHPHLADPLEPLDSPTQLMTQEQYEAKIAYIQEMAANITLAYRHLEDARMRLGKAIQASDGGTSVYKD